MASLEETTERLFEAIERIEERQRISQIDSVYLLIFHYTRHAYFSFRYGLFMHLTGIKRNLDMDGKRIFRSFRFYSNVTENLLSAYRKTREIAYAYLGKPVGEIYDVEKKTKP